LYISYKTINKTDKLGTILLKNNTPEEEIEIILEYKRLFLLSSPWVLDLVLLMFKIASSKLLSIELPPV
jgi:hypothetical protein